jgi:hypothetical protein
LSIDGGEGRFPPSRIGRSPILHRRRAAVHCLVTVVGATIWPWQIFS